MRAILTLLLLASAVAFAHPGSHHADLSAGLAHPLMGFDHVLAMLAVGAVAARLAGHTRWSFPLAFVVTMALGAVAASFGWEWTTTDALVAVSLLILGVCAITPERLAVWTVALLILL